MQLTESAGHRCHFNTSRQLMQEGFAGHLHLPKWCEHEIAQN